MAVKSLLHSLLILHFLFHYGKHFNFRKHTHAQTKYPRCRKSKYTGTSKWYLYTWYRYDATRDLIPKVAYTASCWTCSDASRSPTLCQPPIRQGRRGMSVPKPRHWQGEPFHPSSSVITHDKSQFLFVFGKLPVVLWIWYLHCTLFFSTVGVHLWKRQSVNSPIGFVPYHITNYSYLYTQ